ncbi:TIR domain-containing protein [Mesorhizobium sp. M0870]|uniref:TIR domain-containing protein n=1 Tax=Mesorhizobium sp. M0870 TaxID=2957016 RepID=UPI003334ED5F
MMLNGECPICRASADTGGSYDMGQVDCERCGQYEVTGSAIEMMRTRVINRMFRARLSHAVRRRSGDPWPIIDSSNLDLWGGEKLPPARAQVDHFLLWIAGQLDDDRMGFVEVGWPENLAGLIGAVDGDAVTHILDEALKDDLVRFRSNDFYGLTSLGWDEVEQALPDAASMEQQMADTNNKRIFIGHGRSAVWRDLKDYLVERLGLEHDEFNREAVAGLSNKERLKTMLEDADFAFLVMTGEDETRDGKITARMNVVHEAGLFQGKLGFERAIVLVEEGCETFSNIEGLGQIRFPKGNINAKVDEIRKVLEREGIIVGPIRKQPLR